MNQRFNAALFHRGKHLSEHQLMDAMGECPICLEKGKRDKVIGLQTHPEVVLLACSRCGGVSSSQMPTEETLIEYYQSYYTGTTDKLTFHKVSRLAKHIFSQLDAGRFAGNEIVRILDLGGGDGSLAMNIGQMISARLAAKRVEVTLVDFNSDASFEDGNVSVIAHKTISDARGKFDVILASAILEHIPELHAVVLDLTSRLAPGGYFYARTPYVVPFKKILKSMDFTFPGHVHDLGPSFWNKFTDTFLLDWSVIFSRSSIVETQFKEAFSRTLLAYVFKFPSRLEEQFSRHVILKPLWLYVGGWEALYVKRS